MKTTARILTYLLLFSFVFTSCKDDDDPQFDVKITNEGDSAQLLVGESLQLSAEVTNITSGNKVADAVIQWSSGNTEVATVSSSGLVEAIAQGKADITASYKDKKASYEIVVNVEPDPDFTISDTELMIFEGDIYRLSVENYSGVEWASDNEAVATIDDDGLITGVGAGEAIITASYKDKKATCKVIIEAKIQLNCSDTVIYLNESFQLSIANYNKDINVDWESQNPQVAKVSPTGLVTGLMVGETTITITYRWNKVTCAVKVSNTIYKYRITLKDKGETSFSVNRPDEFLSQKAIKRRQKQNIKIDASDLPISNAYIKTIEDIGGEVIAKSKWLNTVVVHCENEAMLKEYKKLPFVESVKVVWQEVKSGKTSAQGKNKLPVLTGLEPQLKSTYGETEDKAYYGAGWANITLHNGQALHYKGYKGEGMDIAVLDAGFNSISTNRYLSNIKLKGSKSFIYGNSSLNGHIHGLNVISCMATNVEGDFVGTAPEANYWIFRTEVEGSEYPIEEDYWVAAAEYADSVGVDLINSSLGYCDFDEPIVSYKYEDLDGKTAHITKGANKAVDKGIIVVSAAGNTGKWVIAPSDGFDVLTLGAIDFSGRRATFSSGMTTVDGRHKPDVMALGSSARVIDTNGSVAFYSGTSFASPIMCGLVACLWQAYPTLTNKEIVNVIRQSGNKYTQPLERYGYGVPDMEKAMELAKAIADSK